MSTDVDLHIVNLAKLFAQIEKQAEDNGLSLEGKYTLTELVDKVLPKFGSLEDGFLYVLSNEYAGDYNPAWQLDDFIGRHYGIGDFWTSDYKWGISHANADEVASDLGIDLPEEEDED